MRIFSNAYNPDGADLSWYELYMANSKNFIVRASTDQNSVVDNKNQNDYHCDFNHSLTYFDSITGTERTLGSFITAKRVEKKESKRCNRFNNNEIGCHKFKVGQYNSERLNGESAKTISTGISKDKSNADTIGGLAPVRKDSRANENPHLVETDKGFIDLTIENEDTIAFHESQNTEVFMVDMDLFLQVLVEVLLLKTKEVDNALKKIFIDGDINKDGVLSFTEFNAIVHNVAPQTNQRTILKMFREALMQGNLNLTQQIVNSLCD